jgi:hypothetical protein
MAQVSEKNKTVVDRLDVAGLYLATRMAPTTFARQYNAGNISRRLLDETGPLEAEDLDRWADLCMGVAS